MKDRHHRQQSSQFRCDAECTSCTKNFNSLLSNLNTLDRSVLDEERIEGTYRKGEIIFKENTFPSGLFCLNSGKVMITVSDENGNRIVTNLLQEVNFLGISDFLSGLPYQSSCIALSDVKVCMIKSKAVEELLSNNPTFSRNLITNLARDYNQSCKRLLDITKKNMNVRLASALLQLIDVFGTDEHDNIDVYLKRSEISQICNMNETNVIRHLSLLSKMGAIQTNGKKIRVLNHTILFQEANENYTGQ